MASRLLQPRSIRLQCYFRFYAKLQSFAWPRKMTAMSPSKMLGYPREGPLSGMGLGADYDVRGREATSLATNTFL